VLALLHHDNLVDDQILLRLLFQIHLFDRDTLIRVDLSCGEDATRCTLADLVEALVPFRWVTGGTDLVESDHDVGTLTLTRPSAGLSRWCGSCTWILTWGRNIGRSLGLSVLLVRRCLLLLLWRRFGCDGWWLSLALAALELLLFVDGLLRSDHGLFLLLLVLERATYRTGAMLQIVGGGIRPYTRQ
jgi:hypothetical protein